MKLVKLTREQIIRRVVVFAVLAALIFGEFNAVLPFVTAGSSALLISLILKKFVKGVSEVKSINDIKKGEGLFAVCLCWIFAGIFAAIPYLFFGFSPVNAFFEAASAM